jgi:hypothetical protein
MVWYQLFWKGEPVALFEAEGEGEEEAAAFAYRWHLRNAVFLGTVRHLSWREATQGPPMTPVDPSAAAPIAYRAYGSVTDFKNFRGEPMPEWEALPETIQKAWIAACGAVVELCTSKGEQGDTKSHEL